MRLTHVRLLVRDYGASFAFWRDTIGLPVSFGDEEGPYADFDTGGATLAIFSSAAMIRDTGIESGRGGRGADDVLVVFEVPDVDAAVGRLEQRGVRFVTQPTNQPDWGIRVAHFRDPDGNLVELYTSLQMEAE